MQMLRKKKPPVPKQIARAPAPAEQKAPAPAKKQAAPNRPVTPSHPAATTHGTVVTSDAISSSLTALLPAAAPVTTKPEFQSAASGMCISRAWLAHTSLFRHQRVASDAVRATPSLANDFEKTALRLIARAYNTNENGARRATCPVHGSHVLGALNQLRNSVHGDKTACLTWALRQLMEASPDTLVAKLAEVCDRAQRCSSAQKQAYNIVLVAAGRIAAGGRGDDRNSSLDTLEGAAARVHAVFEDYLDEHKARAYASAVEEPARFYYDAIGDRGGRDHVNVHGTNWYAVALHAALGVSVPLVPEEDDPHFMAVVDFWSGLTPAAWHAFSQRESFGKEMEGVRALRDNKQQYVAKRVGPGPFQTNPPRALRERVANDAGTRKALVVFVERFAHFFTPAFLVRNCFEALNAETKPEHAGFRHACRTLYESYRTEHGLSEESLDEHVYDEYFINLDLGRARRFLGWLGLLTLTEVDAREMAAMRKAAVAARASAAAAARAAAVEDEQPPTPALTAAQRHQVAILQRELGISSEASVAEVARQAAAALGLTLAAAASHATVLAMLKQTCELIYGDRMPPDDATQCAERDAGASGSHSAGVGGMAGSGHLCGAIARCISPRATTATSTPGQAGASSPPPTAGAVSANPFVVADKARQEEVHGWRELLRDARNTSRPGAFERLVGWSQPASLHSFNPSTATVTPLVDAAVRDAEREAAAAAALGGEVCPICCERKEDVTQLPHWTTAGESHGDVSGHRMCKACKAAWGKNECPFCKEALQSKEMLAFIHEFIASVEASSSDANASAAVLEQLQFFEMEHSGQPNVIRRVFGLILADATLAAKLHTAAKGKKRIEWPRDMAGILLRLDAMASAGEFRGVADGVRRDLSTVLSHTWEAFEANPDELDPHYWGAFYTQALVAWLCAWRGGMATDALAASVRRAGRALVAMDEKRGRSRETRRRVCERMHEEYVVLASSPVWGSPEQDVVHAAFFRNAAEVKGKAKAKKH